MALSAMERTIVGMTPTPSPSTSAAARRARGAAALLLGAAALALPASAAADSIVFVQGGNVFSARPDGSGKVKLTDGGNWHSPTQSDDGTIAAVQGTGPIVVMARDGRPLRTITTVSAPSGDGGTFAPRPVELSFSPDGTKIAYAYVADSCPSGSSCGTIQKSTFYTRADVTEATPISVWGNQFGTHNPEWVTNDRTLVFGGYGRQVSIDDLGPGDYSQVAWLIPDGDMGDGELSRDGRRLVTTFGYGRDTTLALFAVYGDARTQSPPPLPAVACEMGPDERLGDPSWSPDGSGLAFETSAGIETIRLARFEAGSCTSTGPSVVLAPGASSPDWGPADPPAARWMPPPRPQQPGDTTPGGDTRTAPRTTTRAPPRRAGGGASVTIVGAKSTTVAALRSGLTVRLRTTKPGRVRVTLRAGRRTVAQGGATARRAGTLTVRLGRVPASAARRLRGRRLTLTAGGASATVRVR
jgi:hypothetical protein